MVNIVVKCAPYHPYIVRVVATRIVIGRERETVNTIHRFTCDIFVKTTAPKYRTCYKSIHLLCPYGSIYGTTCTMTMFELTIPHWSARPRQPPTHTRWGTSLLISTHARTHTYTHTQEEGIPANLKAL